MLSREYKIAMISTMTVMDTNDDDNSVDLTSAQTFYADGDGDGYGTPSVSLCLYSSFRVFENGDDCNDSNEDVNQLADEVWYDGIDQDCDGG